MLDRRTGGPADGRSDVTPSLRSGQALSAVKGPKPYRWAQLLRAVRRVAGMPDYGAYAEHLRRCHPESAIPSEAQFYSDFIKARYEDGPTRCC